MEDQGLINRKAVENERQTGKSGFRRSVKKIVSKKAFSRRAFRKRMDKPLSASETLSPYGLKFITMRVSASMGLPFSMYGR